MQRVGPFALILHRTSDAWYLSYATPVEDVGNDAAAEVKRVLEAFDDAGRVPSFEWIEELAPTLASAVVDAGLPEPDAEPLLVADPDSLVVPEIEGAVATIVTADDDIRALRQVAHQTFPELGPLTEAEIVLVATDIAQRRRTQVAVYLDGRPVAVGDHSPFGGVTEITGIGTLPAYRRRGLGGLVTATLAQHAFAGGCDVVYLTAANDDAASVYRRVGFQRVATGRTTSLQTMPPVDAQGRAD